MINPIIRREMKTSFRSWKIFYMLFLYVFVVLTFSSILLYAIVTTSYNGFNPQEIIALFFVIVGIQSMFIYFVVPAFAGGAISGERERQTLGLLFVTKMSSKSIIIGKLLSSLSIVLLMIICTMPIYAIVFYFGGITISGFISSMLFLIVNAVCAGSISIFFSTIMKKSILSTVLSYIFIMVIFFGPSTITPIIYMIFNEINLPVIIYIVLLSINPVVGFISLIDTQMGTTVMWNLVGSLSRDYNLDFVPFQLWHLNVIISLLLTAFLIFMSSKLLNPVKTKKYHKNKNI